MTGAFDDLFGDAPAPTTGGAFDDLFQVGGAGYAKRDPLRAGSMDEATDIMAANVQHALATAPNPVKVALGAAGKALQPFAAPQQIIFSGIQAAGDLFDGDDETNAWETMKRGGRSALSYATWGGYQAAGLGQGDPRAQAITGYELFKRTGAPNWVARWAGTAADFFLDVPVVGAVGKVAKVDKLTAGLKIGENMAQTFGSPGALRAFAGGVMAAPFTTQPIKTVAEAIPQGVRQAGRERLIDPILNSRSIPVKGTGAWAGEAAESVPVRPTLGQTLIARDMSLPAPVRGALERKQAVMSQYAVLHNEALKAFDVAKKGLDFQAGKELDTLIGRLADESDLAARAQVEGQIRALETRTGRAGLYDDALRAVNKGIQFDVFSAEKLTGAGLMTPEQLAKYQSGEKRHLRRVYSMYGEDQQSHLRRLLDRGQAASVAFDDAGLQQLYSVTLNPATDLKRAPPPPEWKKSELTSGPVRAFPGKTDILDPVQDAARPVWREVTGDLKVGTVDRGALDLPSTDPSDITALRNVLGWDAVKRDPQTGRWRILGGVDDLFPVNHPVIERLYGDLEAQGLVTNVRVEPRSYRDQVPNWYNPKDPTPRDVQQRLADEELDPMRGALYVHSNDMTAFMAGGGADEVAALERALEKFPLRERTRQVGKNTVEDLWLPVDPADPVMSKLIERAKGGGAALFDGATKQPALGAQLPGKRSPSLPSPKEFADAVKAAYTNADQHPADFLNGFFTQRGMTAAHKVRILEEIGSDWAQKAGIQWRPSDAEVVRHFTRRNAAGGSSGGAGGRQEAAVTTARQEVSEFYTDVLGEVEGFTKRLDEQQRVASKAATVNGVIGDIRKYLIDSDLIEQVSAADMGSLHKTAGLRVVSANQARALGNGFKEGEVIPAEIHRILLEQVDTGKDAPLGLAWQWYSSRWQGVKLANPGSIMTNLRSAFVMADQAGHSIPELLGGIRDYMALHRAAVKGDGALDTAARVNGVTMREIFEHGAFTHNTLMNAEVHQRSSRLLDELANPAGSPLQQKVAAMQEWLTETAQGAGVAGAYRTAVTPMRWLGDTYGRVDSMMKGGLYMAQRKRGIAPEQAAKVADETFFNYENVPYVVDGLRRFGLAGMPFASFKLLAAGRFMRSMYQNPYGVQRYYRLPNSSQAALADEEGEAGNGKSLLQEYQEGSPEYVRQGLYIPLGVDSEGRQRAVRLDDILPETAVFDAFNADGVAGTIPPAVQLAGQLISGVGYQGRDVYRTGDTFSGTYKLDKQEAARGVVKQLWQFGAYPWAPGQPMTERIVKAIADKSVPVESISDPKAQAVLKLLTEGPAAPLDRAPWAPDKKGAQPVPDVTDALARLLGVKAYPVTTTTSEPGSARGNMQSMEADLQAVDRMAADMMRQATADWQKKDVRDWVDEKKAEILRRYGKR